MKYLAEICVNPQGYVLNAQEHRTTAQGKESLTEIYRSLGVDYPKFFKMDTLSRLGFVASELLLQAEVDAPVAHCSTAVSPRFTPREDRAVIVFNAQASLCNDRHYQATIQEADHFFPSPALFVYTLPNIVTGELAIRNKYFGETSCYVLERFQPEVIAEQVIASFLDPMTHSALTGWVDATADNQFEATLLLVEWTPAEKEALLEASTGNEKAKKEIQKIKENLINRLTQLYTHGRIN